MRKFVTALIIGGFSVSAHAEVNIYQQKAEKTKNSIVANVNSRQKIFSDMLNIQLKIDKLRVEIAGTRDAQKREILRKNMALLERQKKALR